MQTKIFKFGGASVKDSEGFKNVSHILQRYQNENIVVVVSAIGKTTNALERVVHSYLSQDNQVQALLDEVRKSHYDLINTLFIPDKDTLDDINDTLVEIEWILEEAPDNDHDYIYDQIVSIGELLSSKILYHYAKTINLNVVWQDIRDIIITDNTYRDARVNWDVTTANAINKVKPKQKDGALIITQGFIGSTSENFTTTLGREGSDYTAAILAYCLDADSVHVWKDVPGILTGDPRLFENVSLLPRLSYKEAIEMTYYGAKVIHPKTIKPLQNKNIRLYVRPFLDMESKGTVISDEIEFNYPPVVVIESDQVLLHISTNDFSFVAEHHLSRIFQLLAKSRVKVNMMRNTAISFTICANDIPLRIENFIKDLGQEFKVVVDTGLELITLRHFNEEVIRELKHNKLVLFEEKIEDTLQMVVRKVNTLKRKES